MTVMKDYDYPLTSDRVTLQINHKTSPGHFTLHEKFHPLYHFVDMLYEYYSVYGIYYCHLKMYFFTLWVAIRVLKF
jgi:hypothetical protein